MKINSYARYAVSAVLANPTATTLLDKLLGEGLLA
jgi:hypothetical protein